MDRNNNQIQTISARDAILSIVSDIWDFGSPWLRPEILHSQRERLFFFLYFCLRCLQGTINNSFSKSLSRFFHSTICSSSFGQLLHGIWFMQPRSKGNRDLIPSENNINLLAQPSYNKGLQVDNQEDTIPPPQNIQNNQQHNQQPNEEQQAVAQRRLIGAGDEPNFYTLRYGITPPAIHRPNFDINSNLFQAVQNKPYHGLPLENPYGHLLQFDRLCNLTKIEGVSEDALKLRLFPFSLAGPAAQWEMDLTPGSITTWEQCKTAFLAEFYTPIKTAKIRTQIKSFLQFHNESFSETWKRFKKYQMDCPHHGIPQDSLLSTFYRGLTSDNRRMLDTASHGNFLLNTIEDGTRLITNMANSDAIYGAENDRTNRRPIDADYNRNMDIKALTDKIDQLILGQQKNYEVNMVGDDQLVHVEEASYMQNNDNFRAQQQPYYNQYNPNPNLSYKNPYVAHFQGQSYRTQSPPYQPHPQHQQPAATQDVTTMLQQIIKEQTAHTAELSVIRNEFNRKIDGIQTDMINKFESLNSRVQFLERHISTSSNLTVTGQLPAKSIQNPIEYTVNSVTVSSEQDFSSDAGYELVAEDSNFEEGEANLSKDKAEKEDEKLSDAPPLDNLSNQTSECRVPSRVTEKTLFPKKFSKGYWDEYKRLFSKEMRGLMLRIPINDAFTLIPQYLKFIKEAVKDSENEVTCLRVETHECSAITQIRSKLEKLQDPGTFTLPCSIGRSIFTNCLCDPRKSISLMPLSIANSLGLKNYEPCKFSLVLADGTVRFPLGLLKGVAIRVEEIIIRTDFVVIDMDGEPKEPLILGRPFLAIADAMIDVKNGKIELNLGPYRKPSFDIDGPERKPTIGGQLFSIEGIDQMSEEKTRIPKDKCSKSSDYITKTPMYEEVVDGKSMESLFECNEIATSSPEEFSKLPMLDLGPDIILKPLGYVNGEMEYKVKSSSRFKPFAKVRQLLSHSKRPPDCSGPFEIKKVMPCGSIVLIGKKDKDPPWNGKKVKLYLVAEEERTPPPLLDPPC